MPLRDSVATSETATTDAKTMAAVRLVSEA
jgi:hypothetical protein